MLVRQLPPAHAQLKPFVRSFMLMELSAADRAAFPELAVPACDVTALLFPLSGGAYHLREASGAHQHFHIPFLHGQLSTAKSSVAELHRDCSQNLVLYSTVFTPLGLQAFTRHSLGGLYQIENNFLTAEDHIADVCILHEQLQEIYYAEISILLQRENADFVPLHNLSLLTLPTEEFLLNTLFATPARKTSLCTVRNRQQAEYICRRLTETRGKARIEEIATELDLSERHSLRIMTEYVGVSGKTFGEVQRFLAASRLLTQAASQLPSGERISSEHLHTIIHRAGYYDQSHCIRDFKRFADRTPLQFLYQRHPLAENLLDSEREV